MYSRTRIYGVSVVIFITEKFVNFKYPQIYGFNKILDTNFGGSASYKKNTAIFIDALWKLIVSYYIMKKNGIKNKSSCKTIEN